MNFYKALGLSSILSATNILSAIIITKITSKLIGPTGTAIFGQFNNLISIMNIITIGCITTGLIKYIAQYKNQPALLEKYISTSVKLVLILSLISSFVILIFYRKIGFLTFYSNKYNLIIFLYAFLIILNSFNIYFDSFLNGISNLKKLTFINLICTIFNFIFTAFLILNFKVLGCLLAICLQILTKFLICYYYKESILPYFKNVFKYSIDIHILKRFLKFSLIPLNSIFFYIVISLIRTNINNKLGLYEAGLWSSMIRLSDFYLVFFTSMLNTYYYPKLTELQQNEFLLIREIRKGFKRILPMVLIVTFLIYVFRDLIILTFLSKQFLPIRNLFLIQFLGDFISIFGWFFHIQFLINDKIKIYIIYSFVGCIIYYLTAILLLPKFGIISANIGFLALNIWALCFALFYYKKLFFGIVLSIFKKF